MKYLFLVASLLTFNSMAYAGDQQDAPVAAGTIICFPTGECVDMGDIGIFP